MKAQILFQTSHDLSVTVHRSDRLFFINIIGLAGGVFVALFFVIGLFFKLWVAWLMHLTIVRNLFKIDPSKQTKPKTAAAMAKKPPQVLLGEARNVAKKRVNMTNSFCDRFTLLLEAVIGQITCKATKFAKILQEGRREIKEDLNVFNFMKKMRLLSGTVNALTTFNQRRLLMHQVETSFLLKPYSKSHDTEADTANKKKEAARKAGSAKKKRRILDSEDESSEEDFYFLEKALKDSNELDPVD